MLTFEAEIIAVDTDAEVTVYIGSCPGFPRPHSCGEKLEFFPQL